MGPHQNHTFWSNPRHVVAIAEVFAPDRDQEVTGTETLISLKILIGRNCHVAVLAEALVPDRDQEVTGTETLVSMGILILTEDSILLVRPP